MLPLLTLMLACAPQETLSPAAERGREVYRANCTACHHADPSKTGPVGPAVKGSSRALIETRVVRGAYPDGYTPKRDTHLMKALPHLEPHIDDLAAYLRSSTIP